MDEVLKIELGSSLRIDVPGIYETFLEKINSLETTATSVFAKCQKGNNPLYSQERGRRGWLEDVKEKTYWDGLLSRSKHSLISRKMWDRQQKFNERPLAQPNLPLAGSTVERKLDVGFTNDLKANEDLRCLLVADPRA